MKINPSYLLNKIFIVLFFVFSYSLSSQTISGIYYVNASNTNTTTNGSTWAAAFKTVEEALVEIEGKTAGAYYEVWIAEGSYTSHITYGNLNGTASFSLLGGFSGAETANSQRDWVSNPVVFSKNSQAALLDFKNAIATFDGITINNYTIGGENIFQLGTGCELNLKHCTIKNCKATDFIATSSGALNAITIKSCLFWGNNFSNSLFNCQYSNLAVSNNTFYGNTYTNLIKYGGALYGYFANNVIEANSMAEILVQDGVATGNANNLNLKKNIFASKNINTNTNTNQDLATQIGPNFNRLSCGYLGYQNITNSPCENLFYAEVSFIDATKGNFRVADIKPTKNTGDNTYVTAFDLLDLDNNPRTKGTAVDIGAYENQECNPYLVTKATDNFAAIGGECGDLRYAIEQANSTAIKDTIRFAIAGTGVHTISLSTQLPAITKPLVMDGFSQPGASAYQGADSLVFGGHTLKIQLKPSTNNGTICFLIESSDVSINGFSITGFDTGIYGYGSETDTLKAIKIAGNYIGLEADGTATLNTTGVYLTYIKNSIVGGSSKYDYNVISGRDRSVFGSYCTDVSLVRNIIGASPDAKTAIATNAGSGVSFQYSSAIKIGLEKIGAVNVVAGSSNISNALILFNNTNNSTIVNNNIGLGFGANPVVLGGAGSGIIAYDCTNLVIGSDSIRFYNKIIGMGQNGIAFTGTKGSYVNKNIIHSNKLKGISLGTKITNIQMPTITSATNLGNGTIAISGTTSNGVNAIVQVYADSATKNQGKVFLGSANSGTSGNWSLTISDSETLDKIKTVFANQTTISLTATASYPSVANDYQSSEFSVPVAYTPKPVCYGVVKTPTNLTPSSAGAGVIVTKTSNEITINVLPTATKVSQAVLMLDSAMDMSSNKILVMKIKSTDTTIMVIQLQDAVGGITTILDGLVASLPSGYKQYRVDFSTSTNVDFSKITKIIIFPAIEDNVKTSIIEIDSILFRPVLGLNLLAYTTECIANIPKTFSANITNPNYTYNWTVVDGTANPPTSKTSSIGLSKSSFVKLEVTDGVSKCKASDHALFEVIDIPTGINANKTTICTGDSAILKPNVLIGYDSIQWYNASKQLISTRETLFVKTGGSYYFTKYKGTCSASSNTVTIIENVVNNNLIPQDTFKVCQADTTLDNTYTWYAMLNASTPITVLKIFTDGDYLASKTDITTGCIAKDTVHYQFTTWDYDVVSSTDTIICLGATTTLSAKVIEYDKIQWYKLGSPNIGVGTSNSISVADAGTYFFDKYKGVCATTGKQITLTKASIDTTLIRTNLDLSKGAAQLSTTLLTGETINWYKVGTSSLGSFASISFTAMGDYFFTKTASSGCSVNSDTVAVIRSNTAPVARDTSITIDEDASITIIDISKLISDIDASDVVAITTTTIPSNGTVSFVGKIITYTTNTNFDGVNTIIYFINDGKGGLDTATITITVNAVNDAPTLVGTLPSLVSNQDTTIAVLTSDIKALYSDVDADDVVSVSNLITANGATVSQFNGVISYLPNAGFSGSDNITFDVCDNASPMPGCVQGVIAVNVNAKGNTTPTATNASSTTNEDTQIAIDLTTNVADANTGDVLIISIVTNPANGTSTVSGETVTYTPSTNFNGTESFTYQVNDGKGGLDTATITITVNAVNDAPTVPATNPTFTAIQGATTSALSLTGYSDFEKNNLTLTITSSSLANAASASTGVLGINYTPTSAGTGVVIFRICDDGSPTACIQDTAIVTVSPVSANCTKHSLSKIGTDICANTHTLSTAPQIEDSKIYSYQWFYATNTNKIIGATANAYEALVEGTYFVYITDGATCDTTIETSVAYGQTIPQITGTSQMSVSGGTGYQWYVDVTPTIRAIVGATAGTYTPVFSGTYSVLVTYANCKLMSNAVPTTTTNGAVQRAGLKMTDTEIWISETATPSLLVYPNPSQKEKLHIDFASHSNSNLNLRIFAMDGVLLGNSTLAHDAYLQSIDLSALDLATGVYLIQIAQDSVIVTERIIIY